MELDRLVDSLLSEWYSKSLVHCILPQKKYDLVGYTDSDWAGDMETHKSISEYVFYLGNEIISWSSKKQSIVALSTTGA